MKKTLLFSIIICIMLIFLKYSFSDYILEYKIGNYDIITNYKDKRIYYEIKLKDKIYNFDIYKKRSFSKYKIDSISLIEDENFSCIVPKIKNISTYPLCYIGEEYTDYYLIDSPVLEKYKNEAININKANKDFVYYNNLSNDEYIALWNYKGYIVMNGKSYNYVELFKKDRYDNSHAFLLGDTLYTANYNEEHEYSKLVSLNLKTLKTSIIELKNTLDYDSYIVGNVGKKLYIFDNKYSVLYEINTKNNKVSIISNNEKGYVKYDGKDFISCSKSEYKVDKIKYNSTNSIYNYSIKNGVYKTISDNKKIIQKINNEEINIIGENNNEIYYSYKDNFYKYDPQNGSKVIFYNYELSFNNINTMFVYLNN